jgi:hypothetical protein
VGELIGVVLPASVAAGKLASKLGRWGKVVNPKTRPVRIGNKGVAGRSGGQESVATRSTIIGHADTVAAKTGERIVIQTAKERDLIFLSTKIGDDVIEFGGIFSKYNGTLTIKNFGVDGALTNRLGIRGIKDIVADLGRQQGVNQVIIQGAQRTTGANPGKIPSQLIFKIDWRWQK